ncbi:MAG: AmmeMemoRadiSam system protein B [Candidatus Cloacimonadota bacterium]|nr:MAG: AmmeMemoRadiSam system protein B [Candidatus Cloacimonadota bacterium]
MNRNPVVAGSFYPGDSSILKNMINDYLQKAIIKDDQRDVLGVISPHAGYVYSGQCAAFSFNALKKKDFDLAVIIAPSHRFADFDFSLGDYDKYLTPLGGVKVAKDIVKELKDKYNMGTSYYANNIEHSLEVQLPFLQQIKPDAKLVPILLGEQNAKNSKRLASILTECFKDRLDKTVFIISSDLSHYHDNRIATEMDKELSENFEDLNINKMKEDFQLNKIEACGMGGVLTLMNLAKELKYIGITNLDYRNSGEVSGDYKQVVGYLSSCVYK